MVRVSVWSLFMYFNPTEKIDEIYSSGFGLIMWEWYWNLERVFLETELLRTSLSRPSRS